MSNLTLAMGCHADIEHHLNDVDNDIYIYNNIYIYTQPDNDIESSTY
jgi:hypothetical protein